jgi:hypothetical protein
MFFSFLTDIYAFRIAPHPWWKYPHPALSMRLEFNRNAAQLIPFPILMTPMVVDDEEALTGGLDHYLFIAHHVGKELNDFIALAAEGVGNLTNRTWPVLYHRQDDVSCFPIDMSFF